MNRICILIFMSSCLYLTSCDSQAIIGSYPFLEESESEKSIVTILFSDEHNHRQEHNYYDALIEAQQTHPNKLSNVNIVSASETELIDYYEVEDFPTLLLVEDLDVKLRIEGVQDLSFISSKLEIALEEKFDAAS
ncbi:hypothetical protein [Salipaludibacillus daqingensis]|uniref:hypothetical protein n=1 Tax=Salipaludibacillus daqingensis TaxID=3041001 RepID=UPI0024730656|nr:hypothetical protein [Salipaludibacillus daqingensis]